ncbi:MAG: NrfD/PsrC family molybdoenzyme membrane anchor subunit [Chloroflexota bacterium]
MLSKKLTYAFGVLALLAGVWGIYTRLFVGERDVNYGSYVVWGLWVAMYLFFAGAATGSYMFATMEYLFNIKLFKGTGKAALWSALICMPAALATIGMDLGHMERIVKVYLSPNPFSLLAQMVWGYTSFIAVILATMWLVYHNPEAKLTKWVLSLGLFLAIFLSGGVGALLGVNASRAYWHVGLLPVQFPIFSMATGFALLMIVLGWFAPKTENRPEQLKVIGIAVVVLLLIKTYFVWSDFSQSIYAGVPQNVEAVQAVLFGPYSWQFWIVQIGIGTLLPILVLTQPKLAGNGAWAGWMGVFVLVGFAIARTNIVFPALTIPELEGLATAFTGPHLSFDYSPSLLELSVVSGVVGGTIIALLLGFDFKRLNIFTSESEVKQ